MANFKNYQDDRASKGNAAGGILAGNSAKTPAGGQQQGTGWTNLQTYLDGNKGAGAGMAKDITKTASDEIASNDVATNQWRSAAKGEVDKGTKQNAYGNTFANGTAKDISGIDTGAYTAWKSLPNYTGANNAQGTEGYNDTYSKVQNTKDKITNLNTYEGQKKALSDTYGQNRNYGSGFQSLDAFLTRGDESGKKAPADFQTQNANYGQGFENAKTDVNSFIGGADGRGAANRAQSDSALANRTSTLINKGTSLRNQNNGGLEGAVTEVNSLFNKQGLAPQTQSSFTGKNVNIADQYINQTNGDANAYIDSDENAALAWMQGNDDDANSIYSGAGTKASANVDYSRLQADINRMLNGDRDDEQSRRLESQINALGM